ncbi:FdtA/QdtA family cupin domain-containing protein [Persicitalea sp.]|uniref:sugar 3,4-ketoisomerase n=1 Tax=Persicitalea sp. TaxID=3100273 RepID=UPI0035930E35
MPNLVKLKTVHSDSGSLSVFEKLMPGTIKRVYYIYGTHHIPRGGHRHHSTWNALICLRGQCRIYVHNGVSESLFVLNQPNECLILEPKDWYKMEDFSDDAILLILSNQYYSVKDYIDDPYQMTDK